MLPAVPEQQLRRMPLRCAVGEGLPPQVPSRTAVNTSLYALRPTSVSATVLEETSGVSPSVTNVVFIDVLEGANRE